MNFSVEFTDVADMEAQEIWLYLLGRNPNYAERWQRGLEEAVASLETFPRRCSLAPENRSFPYELRQLLYGSYRLLFTLIDADGDGENDTVRILHIRHQAQRWLDDPDED
jgi:plasmid stabilization system protein ParE